MSNNDAQMPTVETSVGANSNVTGPYSMMIAHARDGMVLQNLEGKILAVNPAYEAMFGYRADELIGRNPLEFAVPEDQRPDAETIAAFRYTPDSPIFESYEMIENLRADGTRFWNQLSFGMIGAEETGSEPMVVVSCRDVSTQVSTELALRDAKTQIEYSANHDDLTGLSNRKRLLEFLNSDIISALMQRGSVGLLQIDLHNFKQINDTLGHEAGDAVLRQIATQLRGIAKGGNLACRIGGDEFVLVLLNVPAPEALMIAAKTLAGKFNEPLVWEDHPVHVSVKIGASMSSPDVDGDMLIQQAEQALYRAKAIGTEPVLLYTEELGRTLVLHQQQIADLRVALLEDQFVVYLQPQLNLRSGEVIGFEALIRWKHPTRGILVPGAFLSAAEQANILADIDYISMNHSLDALASLRRAGFADLKMSINVSGSILGDINYPNLLDWAIQSRDIPVESICVEILETTILENGDMDISNAVEKLSNMGIEVALDDFGTGYAGLAHMAKLEVDTIKLDRSMIMRLDRDPRNKTIIRAITELCADLGVNVVAEGVETQEQLDLLYQINCPVIQGYGLARPMPLVDVEGWLRDFIASGNRLQMPERRESQLLRLKR